MVKVEVESKENYKEFNVSCPQCGSENIRIDKKGYGAAKGLAGVCCCGWPGLLCGFLGSKKMEGFCFNCGNKFDVEDTIKRRWQEKK